MRTYSAIKSLLALICLLLITACQSINPVAQTQNPDTATIPTSTTIEPTRLSSATQTSAPQNLNPSVELQAVLQPQGPVAVQNMLVLNADPFGNVLQMEFVNTGDQDLNISIPCGQVFEPSGEGPEQSLMVIQNTEFKLPAGEIQTVSPYLACVDSDKSIPASGTSYQIGTLVNGNLLSLAECICSLEMVNEDDDFNNLTLQFAVWMVSDDLSFDDMLAQTGDNGALNQFTGGATGQAFSQFTDAIAVPAMDVIRSCNIAIP